MNRSISFEKHLNDVRYVLKKGGVALDKIQPQTSLIQDLKLNQNDYYFLMTDLEDLLHKHIDIDKMFACTSIADLATLIDQEKNNQEVRI